MNLSNEKLKPGLHYKEHTEVGNKKEHTTNQQICFLNFKPKFAVFLYFTFVSRKVPFVITISNLTIISVN